MAARGSMAELIARLRTLVGDTASPPVFEDDDIQAFLDDRRTDVTEAILRSQLTSSGAYVDHTAPRRFWEDSVVLHDAAGNELEPDSADLIVGRWTFDDGQVPPVYITGSFYDLFGSANAVLEAWAAKAAAEFDFATDGQTFNRSQKREGLLAVAREYARKATPPGRAPAWRSSTW